MLCETLKYCHNMGIVHRDLKPENILYESESENSILKLADFGVSKILTNPSEMISTVVGTTNYQPPELIKGKKYNEKCDVYALGTIFYILLCGYPPFDDSNKKEFMENVMKGNLKFPKDEWELISEKTQAIIMNMMNPDPSKRFTID